MRKRDMRFPLGIALMSALYCCLVCTTVQADDGFAQTNDAGETKGMMPADVPGQPKQPGDSVPLGSVPGDGGDPGGGPAGGVRGACCFPVPGTPGVCVMLRRARCEARGGIFQGHGTTCQDPNIGCAAPPIVPCCLPDGGCVEVPLPVCENHGGRPHPNAEGCDTVMCGPPPELGACCIQTNASLNGCLILNAPLCELNGGVFLGAGVGCDSPDVVCRPLPPPIGACCFAGPCGEVRCVETFPQRCEAAGGVFAGRGTSCDDPNIPCHRPPVGACCLSNDPGGPPCIMVPADVCIAEGGAYQGDGTHCGDPSIPCHQPPPPVGACCLNNPGGPPCIMVPADVCIAEGGAYQGDDTTCGSPNDPLAPCRP